MLDQFAVVGDLALMLGMVADKSLEDALMKVCMVVDNLDLVNQDNSSVWSSSVADNELLV